MSSMNHSLTWKMDGPTRERCIDLLKNIDERVTSRIRLLHAMTAGEIAGGLSHAAACSLCPDYVDSRSALELIGSLIKEFLPPVIYEDADTGALSIQPYAYVEVECSWCTDEDLEESLICPCCYGVRRVTKKVVPVDLLVHDTIDVFVCREVSNKRS